MKLTKKQTTYVLLFGAIIITFLVVRPQSLTPTDITL
jgi:hypothetical protein